MQMTFHETFGNISETTLRLVKRYNVSPADYDCILDRMGLTWMSADSMTQAEWTEVDNHILGNLRNGMYFPTFF